MRTHKVAAMGGDGIGPEVVDAAVEVLKVCAERDGGFALDFRDFDGGVHDLRADAVPAHGGDLVGAHGAKLLRDGPPSLTAGSG